MKRTYSLYLMLFEHDGTEEFNFGPVYHGGTWDGVKPIKTSGRGALGVGAYFTPIQKVASDYATESGGKVVSTYLKIHNPLKIYTDQSQSHPLVDALVALGINQEKASALVEREEEKYGYMGTQIKKLAMAQGYDALFQYVNGSLREIVIWNANQVQYK